MKTIGKSSVVTFVQGESSCIRSNNNDIRNRPAHCVSDYLELAKKVAELQYRNRDSVLFFRGQTLDVLNRKRNTSVKPTILRSRAGLPDNKTLIERYDKLKIAEEKLLAIFAEQNLSDGKRLEKYRIVRWSILQHYEICDTPLLDVTHSLRIAASFASLSYFDKVERGENVEKPVAFIFVLGVPNLSGAVTASAEAGLQIVRLASVCPPRALRPHIQEGYLLGEYPELFDMNQKSLSADYEIDFGRRLIAKFSFNPKEFWKNDNFPRVSRDALYPSARDDDFFADVIKGFGIERK